MLLFRNLGLKVSGLGLKGLEVQDLRVKGLCLKFLLGASKGLHAVCFK